MAQRELKKKLLRPQALDWQNGERTKEEIVSLPDSLIPTKTLPEQTDFLSA